MSYEPNARRYFQLKRIDDLNERCLLFIHKIVTVRSWHENWDKHFYPNDIWVGLQNLAQVIEEEGEVYIPPVCPGCGDQPCQERGRCAGNARILAEIDADNSPDLTL